MSKTPFSARQAGILEKIADIQQLPQGAYNFRVDGKSVAAANSEHVRIEFKQGGAGIDVYVAPNTPFEHVHIPVVISNSGLVEQVRNDFHIGAGAHVQIVAGCGIHTDNEEKSQHDGIHAFHLAENSRVTYIEKHYGEGSGNGQREMNPITEIEMQAGSYMEMDTIQIEGVDTTTRLTKAVLGEKAQLLVKEKLLTSGSQFASSEFNVLLNGAESSTNVISRSVAKESSEQVFLLTIDGNAACKGHSECDAIIMNQARVRAIPEISANHVDAELIHEAAIGKIAGEQIVKLMTLGMSQEEAEQRIIEGFLK